MKMYKMLFLFLTKINENLSKLFYRILNKKEIIFICYFYEDKRSDFFIKVHLILLFILLLFYICLIIFFIFFYIFFLDLK
jgi:hypothetical protein